MGLTVIAETCPDMKDRFIVQIYDKSEYDAVCDLGFSYILFTLYRLTWMEKTDWISLSDYSHTHPLVGFTFSSELCDVNGFVEGMLLSGVPLYIHTVNDDEERFFAMGISGIYTDYAQKCSPEMGTS